MIFSQVTLAFGISMVAGVLSLLLGAFSGKRYSAVTGLSIIIFCTILPIAMYFVYLQIEPSVLIFDWPLDPGSFLYLWNPFSAIWLVSMFSGFLGVMAGNYWGQGDDSCFRCLLGPFILIFVLSIVIIFLP